MNPRTIPPTLLLLVLLLAACGGDGGGVLPDCGDGAVEGTEECDDGNARSCDGCSADCIAETGWICGDGELNESCGEQCDDGNTIPDDGCDAECRLEECGDGELDAGEDCDDGNTASCDGCSADCIAETGWICGDGALNESCGEQCDDSNTASCDGCSSDCMPETGWICGDGELNESCGEQCDDGNTSPDDGCGADCRIEIHGEYDVTITVVSDACDLASGSANSPMLVEEKSESTMIVDIPFGGAGGDCNPQIFDRVDDTLTLSLSFDLPIDSCLVHYEVVTELTFDAGIDVTGHETEMRSAVSGDCTGLDLPCTREFDLVGARCNGCFQCVAPSGPPSASGGGPLGAGFGPVRGRPADVRPRVGH